MNKVIDMLYWTNAGHL